MRDELVLGIWLILCRVIGGVRALFKYRRDPTGRAWLIEGILALVIWGIGLVLLVSGVARLSIP